MANGQNRITNLVKRLLPLALLFVLALSVTALQESFLVSGPQRVSVTACSQEQHSVVVTNNGQITSSYQIALQGPPWASVSPTSFVLKAGQSQTVTQTISTPCNAQSTSLTTIVQTVLGTRRDLTQTLTISIPRNVRISALTSHAIAKPCEPANYTITIQNVAPFPDTYTLKEEANIPLSASSAQLTLQSGQQAQIPVTVLSTDCSRAGRYTINAVVTSSSTGFEQKMPLTLDVINPGIPQLQVPPLRIDYQQQSIPLTITNTGPTRTYTAVTGIPWAKITPPTITINKGQTKTVHLELAPPPTTTLGVYKSQVILSGDKQYSFPLYIHLKPKTFWEKNKVAILSLLLLLLLCVAVAVLAVQYTSTPEYKEKRKKALEEKRIKQQQRLKEKQEKERQRALEKAKQEREKEKQRIARQKSIAERKLAGKERAKKVKQKAASIRKSLLRLLGWIVTLLVLAGVIYAIWRFWDVIKRNKSFAIAAVIALAVVLFVLWLRKLMPKVKQWFGELKKRRLENKLKRNKERKEREQQRRQEKEKRRQERETRLKQKEEEKRQRIEHRQKALLSHWEQKRSAQLQDKIDKEYRRMNYVVGKKDVVQHVRASRAGWFILLGVILVVLGLLFRYRSVVLRHFEASLYALLLLALLYLFVLILRTHVIRIRIPVIVKEYVVQTKWDLTHLSIEALRPVKNLELRIRRSRRNLTFLPPMGKAYKYYRITANVRDEHLGKATLTFRVPKSWEKQYKEIRIARLTSKWENVSFAKVSEDQDYTHYQAESDKLVGTYVVYGVAVPITKTKKTFFAMPVLPVLIGVVLALLLLTIPRSSTNPIEGIPPQTWQQDTIHTLNLTRYFTDPDNDALTYVAQPTKNVRIDIFRDTATFVPNPGFSGRAFTKFRATDGKGGSAESNTVVLNVQKTIFGTLARTIVQAVLAVILVILTLLYGLRSPENGEHAQKKKQANKNTK